MKKLSKLIESIWSDIQDRSAGETVRKEDNVDFLEPDDFVAHIRKIYRVDNTPYDIENRTNSSTIFIPICSCGVKMIKLIGIYFDYDEGVVYTHKSIKKYIPKLWTKLDQNFDLWDDDPDYQYYIIINPKDTNRKITNSYVLEVLNFIIDNIYDDVDNDTVKPCLFRRTNESIWSDIQDRSTGDIIRDEDKFNPDYVDFGPDTTVYWAIDNLEIDGEVKFNFDDVKNYNNNGWRLPTVDEVNQLKWNIRIPWYDGCKHLKFEDGNELRLKTNGSGGFHMWTKEINTKFPSGAYAYGFDNSDVFDVTNFNKSINKLFVFLVKDKKVTESIWSDIQDRSSGDTVRKEDEIVSNIKELKPVDMGGSILWADKDLESNDNIYFSFPDANKIIEKSGWRLPTLKEVAELNKTATIYKNTFEEYKLHYYETTHNDLIFKKCGYQYADDNDRLHDYEAYYAWTSDASKSGNEVYQAIRIGRYMGAVAMHYANRCCVRLVKDK